MKKVCDVSKNGYRLWILSECRVSRCLQRNPKHKSHSDDSVGPQARPELCKLELALGRLPQLIER